MIQKIKRKYLLEIYPTVCSDWQKKIANLALNQIGVEIEVDTDLINSAYEAGDINQKKFLKKHFSIVSNKIEDRITCFKDAIKEWCLMNPSRLFNLPFPNSRNRNEIKLNALVKIQIIEEILNQEKTEAWLDWKNSNQYKYFPYFQYKVHGGWCYGSSCDRHSGSDGGPGYYKTSTLAIYAGTTFLKEYKEYITGIIEN